MASNGDAVRAMWAAFDTGGLDAVLRAMDPDVRFRLALAGGRVLQGGSELREHLSALAATGTEVHARVDGIEDVGDAVLVRGSLRVERWGALSESTMVWAHLLRDGRLREVVAFHSRAEALEQLGLAAPASA